MGASDDVGGGLSVAVTHQWGRHTEAQHVGAEGLDVQHGVEAVEVEAVLPRTPPHAPGVGREGGLCVSPPLSFSIDEGGYSGDTMQAKFPCCWEASVCTCPEVHLDRMENFTFVYGTQKSAYWLSLKK